MDSAAFDEKVRHFERTMPAQCPILYSMDIIASKWKIPIIWYLMLRDGQHYNELKRTVSGITNTMLTKSLRELEADGLLQRRDHGGVPPSVTYHLTGSGREFIGVMGELFEWGKKMQVRRSVRAAPMRGAAP